MSSIASDGSSSMSLRDFSRRESFCSCVDIGGSSMRLVGESGNSLDEIVRRAEIRCSLFNPLFNLFHGVFYGEVYAWKSKLWVLGIGCV